MASTICTQACTMTADEKRALARQHAADADDKMSQAFVLQGKAAVHKRWASYYWYAAEHDIDVHDARRRILQHD